MKGTIIGRICSDSGICFAHVIMFDDKTFSIRECGCSSFFFSDDIEGIEEFMKRGVGGVKGKPYGFDKLIYSKKGLKLLGRK